MLDIYEYARCNPNEVKQFSCKELLFLIVECPPEFKKGQEFANHNCFLYGISGKHYLFNNDHSWLFEKGDTVFVKKGGFGVERADDDLFCILIFFVPDSYLRSFINEKIEIFSQKQLSAVSNDMLLRVDTNDVLRSFYESVISHFNAGTAPAEDLIELKFKELLLNIVTNPANRELTSYLYKLFLSQADELQDVMERNYMYDLQLEDYARLCHRSLASFKRDFQKVYGTTPGRWLLEKKLETAKRLLLAPEKSVNDAAYESGFKNNTHFSRTFKNFFGRSPLQFKKEQLQSAAVSL
jgi:AraC-like DNA-binding protein